MLLTSIREKNTTFIFLSIQCIIIAFILIFLIRHDDQSAQTHQQEMRLLELDDRIEYLDEVLTMSASMFAATKKDKWKQRYFQYAEQLDAVITETVQLTPEIYSQYIGTTKTANDALTSMEKEIFSSAGNGDKALEILDGDAYTKHKRLYRFGIIELRSNIIDKVSHNQAQLRQRMLYTTGATMFILLALSLIYAQIISSRWRKYHEKHTAELHESEHKLTISKNDAEAANNAKSQFLASMSHELRTPLNAIIGFTHILRKSNKLNKEEHSEYINIIHKSGEHLLALINDIINVAKIESNKVTLEYRDINLCNFLDDIISMMGVRAQEKAILLNSVYADSLPEFIHIDSMKLRQIIINLISNSIKFTDSGTVTLKVNYDTQGHKMQNTLHVEVHDTGVGISPEDQATLFQPFVQTATGRANASGAGLGLSISQHFAQMMGGEIQIDSKLGQGSVFKFSILVDAAADDGDLGETMPERQVRRIVTGQNIPTVLVIDDIEYSRLLVAEHMQRVGFIVHTAKNGQESLKLFKEIQPDLIIMDIIMPVMDGRTAAKQIRLMKNGDKTKMIALTTSVLKEDRDVILACGFDDITFKPLRIDALFALIGQMLDIKFTYHDEHLEKPKLIDSSATREIIKKKFTDDQVAALDDNWVIEFKQKAIEGDVDALHALLNDLPDKNDPIKQQLTQVINEYQFEMIEEILTTDT